MTNRLPRGRFILCVLCLILLPLASSACAAPDDAAESADPAAVAQEGEGMSLQQIMVGIGEDSARLNEGLWVEDFEAIAVAAEAIA